MIYEPEDFLKTVTINTKWNTVHYHAQTWLVADDNKGIVQLTDDYKALTGYTGHTNPAYSVEMLKLVIQKRKKYLRRLALQEKEKDLVKEKESWYKQRAEYVSKQVAHIQKVIDENKAMINKLQRANSILLKSRDKHEIEFRKEFSTKFPFPKARELKNLRNKISRLFYS